jgi:RNA polymerase subunit RPABC4/transcription elongation factor Spt4
MDLERILDTIQPFVVMFVALTAAFLTALWVSAVMWAFRDIRARTRDIFAQILATLLVLIFFPLFPVPGLILYLILRPRETLAEVYERTLEEEALLQGIEERLACPTCNRRIDEDFVVCPSCHTRLKKGCVSCGRLLHLGWTICAYCGAAQTTTKAAPSLQPQPVAMAVEPAGEMPMLATAGRSSLPEPEVDSGADSEAMQATAAEVDWEPMGEAEIETEVSSESGGEIGAEAEAMQATAAETDWEPMGKAEVEIETEFSSESGGEIGAEAEEEPGTEVEIDTASESETIA